MALGGLFLFRLPADSPKKKVLSISRANIISGTQKVVGCSHC
jgi:hypothetical protein